MSRSTTASAFAVAALVFTLSPAAHADFAVTNAGPADPGRAAADGIVSDEPHVGPGDPGGPRAAGPRPHARPRPIRPALVQGFGDAVPLAFACRQIVPESVKITYGPGADPGMIVSWSGGDTWPRVLAAAVKPLGLHLVQSGSTLTLES